jgi:hypothetical protein
VTKVALRLLLLLGFGALGLFVLREVPRDVTLVYAMDDAAAVRRVEVEVRRGTAVIRQAEFRFPSGAPSQIRHDVKLPDGDYGVAVRVWGATGEPRLTLRPVTVAESGSIVLPIGDRTPRND